jgi:hypothetical protein
LIRRAGLKKVEGGKKGYKEDLLIKERLGFHSLSVTRFIIRLRLILKPKDVFEHEKYHHLWDLFRRYWLKVVYKVFITAYD